VTIAFLTYIFPKSLGLAFPKIYFFRKIIFLSKKSIL